MAGHTRHVALRRHGRRLAILVLLRGRMLLSISILVMLLGLLSATGLRWSENVVDLLPRDDPTLSPFLRFIDNFQSFGDLYFDVGPAEGQDPPARTQLVAVADELVRRLSASDYFQRVVYRYELADLQAAIEWITRYRAALFTEADARVFEKKLTATAVRAALAGWKQTLTESPAPLLSEAMCADPLKINDVFVAKLERLQSVGTSVHLEDGRLFSADGRHILLIARPRFPATDTSDAQPLIEFLNKTLASTPEATRAPNVDVAYFGAHRASLDNARQLKRDIGFTVTLSVVAIAALAALVYRRRRLVLAVFAPVVFGAGFALGLLRWCDPNISAVVIGCGSMLIGISVDYGIHLLYNVDQIRPGTNVRHETARVLRRLLAPILLSAITTILAFCVLNFSVIPGYRSLGQFGALGLIGAASFALLALPAIGAWLASSGTREPLSHLGDWFPALFVLTAKWRVGVYLALAAVSLLALAGLRHVQLEGDIQQLNSLSPRTRHDMDRVTQDFGDVTRFSVFAVQGASLDEALQRNDILSALLRRQEKGGVVQSVSSIAELLPSHDTQVANCRRWADFWNGPRLTALRRDLDDAARELRIRPVAFRDFLDSLPGSTLPIRIEQWQRGLLGDLLAEHVLQTPQDTTVLTRVRLSGAGGFGPLMEHVRQQLPGVLAYNGPCFVRRVVTLIYHEAARLSAITLAAIAVLLLIVARRIVVFATMLLPLLVSALWTFGSLGWLGIRINMMNAVVAVFIFGLTVDYSIFLGLALRHSKEGNHHWPAHTCAAIALSALTTLCGMGALALASHPALRSVGVTALIGIASGFVSVLAVILPSSAALRRSLSGASDHTDGTAGNSQGQPRTNR